MEKQLQPLILSWEEIDSLSDTLAEKIKASGFVPEALIGIAVGGLVPLALISRRLNVQNVATISARSYKNTTEQENVVISNMPQADLRGKRVLLIDEIVDTGETLKVIVQKLKEEYGIAELKTAALVVNTINCTWHPAFAVLEVDRWVNFPWEERIV